jgi:hypothetical protein
MDELTLERELSELRDVPIWLWVILAIALLIQSTCLFIDARKHGRYPWFWGIWGLFSIPLPTILYLLLFRVSWPNKKKPRG